MESWLRGVWEKGKNPYIRALVLFFLLLLAWLGLVTIVNDTGFGAEVEKHRWLVWISAIVFALIMTVVWLWWRLHKRKQSVFFSTAQDDALYLRDLSGKLREIPDNDTFTFLAHALSVSYDTLEVQEEEIVRLRGESIDSVKGWKRPLSAAEEARRETRHRISSSLEKTLSQFKQDVEPQKLVVKIANRSKEMYLHIKHIKFQPHRLPEKALSTSYPKSDGSYIVIPLKEEAAGLAPGDPYVVELEFQQTWTLSDIETLKGELGFLVLDVVYNEELVENVLIQL
jgi:hypothetical protein